MLSKIMTQPYDDTFNIEGTQKLQTDYHTTLHLCPATGYPNLESIIISKELVVLFLMICKGFKIYVVAINLKYKKLDNIMHLLISIYCFNTIRLQLCSLNI